MSPLALRLFYVLSKLCWLEITYKLGLDQGISKDSIAFIKNYQGSEKLTGILDETYLQITIWDKSIPLSVFKESASTYQENPRITLASFLYQTFHYYNFKHKTCKHANKS